MRAFGIIVGVALVLGLGLGAAWVALNYSAPGTVGTPAHAGAVSQGRPADCTNVNVNVRAGAEATRQVTLNEGDYVRGTFEADGGFGRVDVLMRLVTPQGVEILVSPRASNYDFTFPAKVRGAYSFVLDNRYSLFTAKSVALYYCVERAG
ncbi:MAG: p24 family protein [Dehalococcoidia bacterium]